MRLPQSTARSATPEGYITLYLTEVRADHFHYIVLANNPALLRKRGLTL